MDFQKHLQTIADSVEGSMFATLMGYDGVAVAEHQVQPREGETPIDVAALLVEFTTVLGQVARSAQSVDAGALEELSVKSQRLTTIIRPVTPEYFLAMAIRPDGNAGKGRYFLRVSAPKIQQDLR
ncbi:MAG: hypothetical protein HYV07_15730 [Deltaproteobacteria bacterium]|nr:hypothetical protein [Deltaproteobacteria bacterium]